MNKSHKIDRTDQNRTRLLEEPVGKTLALLTFPMIFGTLSMVVYNLADTYFVGKLGKEQLAAMSFTFPVVLIVGRIAQGIGTGAAAAISKAIGRNDREKVLCLSMASVLLGLFVVPLTVFLGLLTLKPLFYLLGARGVVLEYVADYMKVWYWGAIFVVVTMIGNHILRSTGDTKTPGVIMMLGALINLFLDPLLIFGYGIVPAYGVKGAAIATVIGRGVTLLCSLYVLFYRERLLSLKVPKFAELKNSWKEILHVGLPDAVVRMFVPLGQGAITGIVAAYGTAAVAGYGAATRVEFLSLMVVNALSSVVAPFVGQNLGAKKYDRVQKTFILCRRFALFLGISLFILFQFVAEYLASYFNTDPAVVHSASLYLRIASLGFAAQGLSMVINSGLNVLKYPLHAAGLSVMELFIFAIPLGLLGSKYWGLPGVFSAIAVSYISTGIIAWTVIKYVLAKLLRSQPSDLNGEQKLQGNM